MKTPAPVGRDYPKLGVCASSLMRKISKYNSIIKSSDFRRRYYLLLITYYLLLNDELLVNSSRTTKIEVEDYV